MSPGRASSDALRTAARMDVARTTGTIPRNASSTSCAASPIATTARSCGDRTRSSPQVDPLVPAARDEDDPVESAHRGHGRVHVRGLRVVDPPDAVVVRDELHSVRKALEGPQRVADRGHIGTDIERERARRERVGQIGGSAQRQVVDGGDLLTVRGHEEVARSRSRGRVPRAPRRARSRTAACGRGRPPRGRRRPGRRR